AARGDLAQAEREFRAAIWSPTGGYTRTNVELAKVLLRLNRPREAAYWADAARHGGLDASQTYTTTTELLERRALAADAVGGRDSAAPWCEQVAGESRDAEPRSQPRVERARLRLGQVGGQGRAWRPTLYPARQKGEHGGGGAQGRAGTRPART